jgi:hypothetical protein
MRLWREPGAKDLAGLFFHGPAMAGGTHAKARLDGVV